MGGAVTGAAEPGGVEIALRVVVALAVYPGGLFLAAAALLAEGWRRQFAARAQGHAAPRLLQPLFDLRAQLGRADSAVPAGAGASGVTLRLIPIGILAVLDVAAALTPLPGNLWPFFSTPLGASAPNTTGRPFGADVLAVALLTVLVPPAADWLAGMVGGSIFAQIAAARAAQYHLAAGLPLLVAIVAPAIAAGTPDFVAVATVSPDVQPALGGVKMLCAALFLIAALGVLRRRPFDPAGAGGEMLGGAATDFGGAALALLWAVRWGETALLAFVFVALYIPFGTQNIAAALGGILLAWGVWGVVEAGQNVARPRDGLRFFLRLPTFAAVAVALGVAFLAR